MVDGDLLHAISVAARAYDGRTDRQGEPYVAHAMRVMLDVEGDEARTVAILHDVLEWGSITVQELVGERFPPHIMRAIDAMTRRDDEPMREWMARIQDDELALEVKRADLRDNAQQWRLDAMPDAATREKMLRKYRRSAELLGTTLDEICGRAVS
ncbi:HD domain-containing protein [Agrococcus sp. TF02-05]|uniref:HD domain-containing protein n=1 Tax=Agrococcus sp. TF02-05 TaxID=2815211 RepID=UPI001AA13884|nr:HD domain-containing protein [Agrococcus sp. TF02-05]MBO1768637.1 HD domain-containing protein [Agrococcus sp. TF02-05]